MERTFFDAYKHAVREHLGSAPGLTAAIALRGSRPAGFDGVRVVSDLLRTLDGEWWQKPSTRVDGNWKWRDSVRAHTTKSPEVVLEREVVKLGGSTDWTYQMSTSSGLFSPHGSKRRAIDLVNWQGDGQLRLIELKVDSDNPLHAIFEVLGYGLLYLLARRHGFQGRGPRNVMTAKNVSLEVLGPCGWYSYPAGQPNSQRLDFSWLVSDINQGLAGLLPEAKIKGLETIGLSMSCFKGASDSAAIEIVGNRCTGV